MNFLVTICIVNFNSSEFILNTLYCLEKLTKNRYKVLIRDNNSKLKDYQKLKNKIINYPNVELYRVENFNLLGSLAHGIALNDLIRRIDTKYGVILDADFTFLIKYWDEILINKMNDQYPIIGTQVTVNKKTKKYLDFPYLYGIMFENSILQKLKIDLRPDEDTGIKDTGYSLRKRYLESGYEGKIIHFKSTRNFKLGPFRNLICGEYYLENYSQIFGSHFGRGSTLGRVKYLRSGKIKLNKIPFIGPKLAILKGRSEREKWIKICKKIVKKQINFD